MTIKVSEAIGDKDQRPGESIADEILVRNFKKRTYEFTEHLRCKNRTMAKQAAEYSVRIAACSSFGYNRNKRWTGAQNIELVGVENLEKADPGDFDCSSFVISCYRFAGCPLQLTGYTGNIRKLLLATGYFEDTTAADPLIGDVWNAPGTHALMVVSGAAEPDPEPEPTKKEYVRVKGENVRVRSGPSTDYPTILIAHKGQTYPYLRTDPETGWYWIETKIGIGCITNKTRYTELIEK